MKVKIRLRIIEAMEIEIDAETIKEAVSIGKGNFDNITSYRKGNSWLEIESAKQGESNDSRANENAELCEGLRSP